MKREIKFRAWEKTFKEMIPVHNINFENKMINSESAWRLFKEIELMQCTGLKDKNGKEVYEGDIFLRDFDTGVVVFKDCSFLIKWDDQEDDYSYLNLYAGDGEVIGNIYENKELLNNGYPQPARV